MVTLLSKVQTEHTKWHFHRNGEILPQQTVKIIRREHDFGQQTRHMKMHVHTYPIFREVDP